MKKLILSLGVGLFLSAFAYHVTVSVDNPMKLVTEEAVVYATGGGTVDCYSTWATGGIWTIYKCGDCRTKKNVLTAFNQGTCNP